MSPHPHRPRDLRDRSPPLSSLRVRVARPEDIPAQVRLSRAVSGVRGAWLTQELSSHLEIFPEGQLVVEDLDSDLLLGLAASLVLDSRSWPPETPWAKVTGEGRFTTHDPEGDILYGAGLAVHPRARGRGVAKVIYQAREALLERMGLSRIRVAARIPGYGRVSDLMSPEAYIAEVIRGERSDPTLSFQLHMGFRFVGTARDYLPLDTESRGHAAVVEWTSEGTGSRG